MFQSSLCSERRIVEVNSRKQKASALVKANRRLKSTRWMHCCTPVNGDDKLTFHQKSLYIRTETHMSRWKNAQPTRNANFRINTQELVNSSMVQKVSIHSCQLQLRVSKNSMILLEKRDNVESIVARTLSKDPVIKQRTRENYKRSQVQILDATAKWLGPNNGIDETGSHLLCNDTLEHENLKPYHKAEI